MKLARCNSRRLLLAGSVMLFAVNLWIVWPLARIEYTRHMLSIEGAYFALARFILKYWGQFDWLPQWYCGIPFQNAYPPLLHFLTAGAAWVLRTSPALAHHLVTAVAYCLGPVALFWLALRLSLRFPFALAAGLLYSLFSPCGLLVPAIRADMGSVFHPRRLQALVHYGEGPHLLSLTLVPLAMLLLVRALEKRSPGSCWLASLGLAAVALSNWLGAFTLALAAGAWLVAQPLDQWRRNWLPAAALGIWAYLMAAPWIPPSTVAAVQHNAQLTGGNYRITAANAVYGAVLLVVLAIIRYAMGRLGCSSGAIFAALAGGAVSAIPLARHWFGWIVVPQPERYHLQMEMFQILALAFAAQWLLGRVRLSRSAVALLVAAAVVAGIFQLWNYAGWARHEVTPTDITVTQEYRFSAWAQANAPGSRVLAPGVTAFWLNVFADNPQFWGGFDQGIVNPWLPHVLYQIYSGENAGDREDRIAVALLQIFGVDYAGVGGREYFGSPIYRNPAKFASLLAPVRIDGKDAIYRIPRKNPYPVRIVRRGRELRTSPDGVLDFETLEPYAAELENSEIPTPAFRWINNSRAEARGALQPDQLLVFQISYHPGWRARVNGRDVPLERDGLGLMLLEPHCQGECNVEIRFDGGAEATLTRTGSAAALAFGAGWTAFAYWLRRRRN